jgi:transposase
MLTVRRYILAIDLGVKGASEAALCDDQGEPVGPRVRFPHGLAGYERLVALVPGPQGPGEQVQVRCVYEATASAWKPLASFLAGREWPTGVIITQYRLKPQDVAQMRKVMRRYAKTDRIDVGAMAKLAATYAASLLPLPPAPSSAQLRLERLARRHWRHAQTVRRQKQRVWALGLTLVPGLWDVVGAELTVAVRTLLRELGDPRALVRLGPDGSAARLAEHHVSFPAEVLTALVRQAQDAVALYARDAYVDLAGSQEEVVEALALLEQAEAAQRPLERQLRQVLDEELDPDRALRSLYGVGDLVASYILAAVGDIGRFGSLKRFTGFTGYYPVVVQSVDDPRGVRLAKAGPQMLKVALYLAAETARQWDPELARAYQVQFMERGKHHLTALCHVATRLAARVYAVLQRMRVKREAIAAARAAGDAAALASAEALVVGYDLRDPRQPAPRPALPHAEAMALTATLTETTAEFKRTHRPARRKRTSGLVATGKGQHEAPHMARDGRTPSARKVAERLGARPAGHASRAATPGDTSLPRAIETLQCQLHDAGDRGDEARVRDLAVQLLVLCRRRAGLTPDGVAEVGPCPVDKAPRNL